MGFLDHTLLEDEENDTVVENDDTVIENADDMSIISGLEEQSVSKRKRVSYSFVQEKCNNVIRLLQGHPNKLDYFCQVIDVITQRAQHGQDFDLMFEFNTKENVNPNTPVVGKIVPNKSANSSKRLKSTQERIRDNHGKRKCLSIRSNDGFINDREHITIGHANRRSCSICQGIGHRRHTCPKINCFGKPPLPFNDKSSQNELSSELQTIETYPIYTRSSDDARSVSVTMPNGSIGLILHKRYFIDSNLGKSTLSNICIECTLLSSNGAVPVDRFINSLFKTEAVVSWILRSSNKVIVNQLEKIMLMQY